MTRMRLWHREQQEQQPDDNDVDGVPLLDEEEQEEEDAESAITLLLAARCAFINGPNGHSTGSATMGAEPAGRSGERACLAEYSSK